MEIIDLLSVVYAEDYCVPLNTVNNEYPTAKCSVIGQLTGITVIYYYTVSLYNRQWNQSNQVFILHYQNVFNPLKIRIIYIYIKHHEFNCPHINSLFNQIWYDLKDHNMAPKQWISIRNIIIYWETKFCPNRRIFFILVAILDSQWPP